MSGCSPEHQIAQVPSAALACTRPRGALRVPLIGSRATWPRPTRAACLCFKSVSGYPQIDKMNMEGADVMRLTTGEGEAVNPAWHPNGQHIVFSWTRGFEFGNFNIFMMDIASREVVQLTHGIGRNENPVWAPDGKHIVFASTRGGGRVSQIWTMLADGTQLKQLTTQGYNEKPVWSR